MIEHDTEKQNKSFTCTICDHTWNRKYDYVQHLKTTKHIKKRKMYEQLQKSNEQIRKTEQTPQENDEECTVKNITNNFCCDYCKFSTPNKKEANQHRTSKQHIMNENKEEDFLEIVKRYTCTKCEKTYDKYKNCWEHVRKCEGKKENIVMEISEIPPVTQLVMANDENIKKDIMESIVEKIMMNNNQMIENNNKQMMEQIVTVVKTILQEIKPSVTQNNTNSNNNNNHYTINMFLNEKCKDAINITDWARQLHIDYDHLYYTGENGFQKGLTNMLVENLKLCDVYNRPIHFTDIKRDSMYIREDDEWTKHENTEKLTEMLEISARQACIRLTDWMKEHEDVPDYHDLDSELGKQYLALMVSVIRPQVERTKAFPKVIKELAKVTQLRKEDQV